MIPFLTSFGSKRTFKLIRNYPQLILTPAFTVFTFGPVKPIRCSITSCCKECSGNGKITLSYMYSWINVIYTNAMHAFWIYIITYYHCQYLEIDLQGNFALKEEIRATKGN